VTDMLMQRDISFHTSVDTYIKNRHRTRGIMSGFHAS